MVMILQRKATGRIRSLHYFPFIHTFLLLKEDIFFQTIKWLLCSPHHSYLLVFLVEYVLLKVCFF